MRFLVFALTLAACSGKVMDGGAPGDALPTVDGAATDSSAGDSAVTESAVIDASIPDADPKACAAAADKLGAMLGVACTTAVRISQIDFRVVGWAIDCGTPAPYIDDASARSALAPYTKYVTIDTFSLVRPGTREHPWIYAHGAGDFGGIGAVDGRTGRAAFYTSLGWQEMGVVSLPTGNAPLPLVCGATKPRAYETIGPFGGHPSTDAAAMAVLVATPLLTAIERSHIVESITLLHAPLDGTFDSGPRQDEWIALITSIVLAK